MSAPQSKSRFTIDRLPYSALHAGMNRAQSYALRGSGRHRSIHLASQYPRWRWLDWLSAMRVMEHFQLSFSYPFCSFFEFIEGVPYGILESLTVSLLPR